MSVARGDLHLFLETLHTGVHITDLFGLGILLQLLVEVVVLVFELYVLLDDRPLSLLTRLSLLSIRGTLLDARLTLLTLLLLFQ